MDKVLAWLDDIQNPISPNSSDDYLSRESFEMHFTALGILIKWDFVKIHNEAEEYLSKARNEASWAELVVFRLLKDEHQGQPISKTLFGIKNTMEI